MAAVFGAAAMGLVFSSCERIYEDLDPCPHGVSLRFIYDYNLEFANAFPNQVDCLTLFIYDEEGNYVDRRIVTGPELQNEDYRMQLDLKKGTYRFVAYGGLACEEKTFSLLQEPDAGSNYTDLRVEADWRRVESDLPEKRKLHDMFWGELTLATSDLYQKGVVKMMKNTNNIRIVLQQMNGEPVDDKDYEFEITDDNTLFSYDNDLLPNGPVTYTPWSQGQASTGVIEGNKEEVVAYAEFSTSRLMTKNSPKMIIKRKADGKEVVNIPLINYLLILKSDHFAAMPQQEFLDRGYYWSMIFFLDSNHDWFKVTIKVNDWVVRVNNIKYE